MAESGRTANVRYGWKADIEEAATTSYQNVRQSCLIAAR